MAHTTRQIQNRSNGIGLVPAGVACFSSGEFILRKFLAMRRRQIGIAACLLVALAPFASYCAAAQTAAPAEAQATTAPEPRMSADPVPGLLDTGFHQLYELNFQGAREQFISYQKARPEDPLGSAAEAASYLYEQFNAKGVFTSAFFLNDAKFMSGAAGSPADNHNDAFLSANGRAREMAKAQLKTSPGDSHALLVLTMTDGMESDYDALIVKKQLAALSLMRQAEAEAAKLLIADPDAKDAYLALGASQYIVGSLPSYKRAFLWFGGIHGDRAHGMDEMQLAADHGHYLSPFAKILLALACEREHQNERARALLAQLATEFPANPLFAHELALVDHPPTAKP
jgi:hypothetical protein